VSVKGNLDIWCCNSLSLKGLIIYPKGSVIFALSSIFRLISREIYDRILKRRCICLGAAIPVHIIFKNNIHQYNVRFVFFCIFNSFISTRYYEETGISQFFQTISNVFSIILSSSTIITCAETSLSFSESDYESQFLYFGQDIFFPISWSWQVMILNVILMFQFFKNLGFQGYDAVITYFQFIFVSIRFTKNYFYFHPFFYLEKHILRN